MNVQGEGWLEQREKNKHKYKCRKWVIRFETECGKKSKYFVGSYADALKARDNFYIDLVEDKTSGGMKFKEYAKKWLKWRKSNPDYSPNTIQKDTFIVKSLVYWFGDYSLAEISPNMIKDVMVDYRSASGNLLSGTGKNMHFVELSSILRSAVNDGLISYNAMDKVPTPKRDTKTKKCLNRREIDYLIECLDKEPLTGHALAIYFMIYMALRSQEAFALKWEDVNFKKKMLKIQRAYKRSTHTIGETKSKASKRSLPIPTPLLEKLKIWHDKYLEEKWDTDLICITTEHSLMRPTTLSRWFDRFLARHEIEHISFHELRHSNLTLMARNMNQFDLQRYAGWSNLEPAQIYVHPDTESLKKSINSVF